MCLVNGSVEQFPIDHHILLPIRSGRDPGELRERQTGDRCAECLRRLQAPRHRHYHLRGNLQVLTGDQIERKFIKYM